MCFWHILIPFPENPCLLPLGARQPRLEELISRLRYQHAQWIARWISPAPAVSDRLLQRLPVNLDWASSQGNMQAKEMGFMGPILRWLFDGVWAPWQLGDWSFNIMLPFKYSNQSVNNYCITGILYTHFIFCYLCAPHESAKITSL